MYVTDSGTPLIVIGVDKSTVVTFMQRDGVYELMTFGIESIHRHPDIYQQLPTDGYNAWYVWTSGVVHVDVSRDIHWRDTDTENIDLLHRGRIFKTREAADTYADLYNRWMNGGNT